MKRILPLLFLLISTASFAQSPNAFNYQAVVRDGSGNTLVNQNIGLRITIWSPSPLGSIVYQESHTPTTNGFGLANVVVGTGTVMSGTFSSINWSAGPYFIEVAVDPTGSNTYAVMGASELVSVPYALHAKSAQTAANAFSGDYNDLINVPSANGNNLQMAYDQGGPGMGRVINAENGDLEFNTTQQNAIALRVTNAGSGAGILARTNNPANTFSAVQAETNSTSTVAAGVVGNSTGAAVAIAGQVQSTATAQSGVYGSNLRTDGGHGVHGIGFNGVVGETGQSSGNAVFGENFDNLGTPANGIGVAGRGYYGVVGECYAGVSSGGYGVASFGDFAATGTKAFLIDHPTDPANKFLKHFSSESNEVLNIYRGNVTFNANGEAVVQMPDYYDLINKNPSYQLTPVGAFAQLFVKSEMENGQFVIAGGTEGMKASWTVYSERNDPYLQQYPEKRNVIVEKREGQKGKYLMPQLYGQSMDKKMIPNSGKTKVEQKEIQLK